MIRYDGNNNLTLEAFKKLERGVNIPVLTGRDLTESKLEGIMEYLEFTLSHSQYRNAPLAVRYIESWIYRYKTKECNIEPTWNNFFDALRYIKLDQLKKDIEDCLLETVSPSNKQSEKKTGNFRINFANAVLLI